ncbi:MAG: hypothetical protein LH649_06810 [Pseudanabaena sp. CAN_BIN31]|nr:hypothetical protein [Pseudanabaena sp. CAN_BIN31]
MYHATSSLFFSDIAIALYCREENPIIGKLCHDLDPIHIVLFTGEQTTEQLTDKIQTWLSRIKLEYI